MGEMIVKGKTGYSLLSRPMNDANDDQATGLTAIQDLMPPHAPFPIDPSTPWPKNSDIGKTTQQIGREKNLRLIGLGLINVPFDCSISSDIR